MNYCIHLKKRKNKPYCNILKQEITFSQCRECVNKEYKTKNVKNSFYNQNNYNKSIIIVKNGIKYNKKNVFLETKAAKKRQTIAKSSKKLTKLERNRYSVFTDDLKHCFLCGKDKEELHEIFAGRNRTNSMKYGFVLPLCHECHSLNQNNPFFNDHWHRIGEEYWICNIGTREEFIDVFKRNYLE